MGGLPKQTRARAVVASARALQMLDTGAEKWGEQRWHEFEQKGRGTHWGQPGAGLSCSSSLGQASKQRVASRSSSSGLLGEQSDRA